MSELLNNTKVKREEHKPNALVHHMSEKKLNIEHVKNNTTLYCYFTRNKCDDIGTKDDPAQQRQKKSPIPSRVMTTDIFKQDKPMKNMSLSSLKKPESPFAITEKINTALIKLHRLNKSMTLFFK